MVDQEVVVLGRRGWVCEEEGDGYCIQFYDQGESLWKDKEEIELYQGEDDYPDWLGLTLINDETGKPWIAMRFDPATGERLTRMAGEQTDGDVGALFEQILTSQLIEGNLSGQPEQD